MNKLFARPIPIDPVTEKANAINLLSIGKPYMRAFHLSWISFLTAFTGWFSLAPLMPTIKDDLKLTPAEVNNSNITSIASTIIFRIIIGPLCDRFGPKRVMASLLVISSIPVGLCGLVTSASGFITVRFFIGVIGATFVPCQFWTTQMFGRHVIGTANALVGGWGNMGGGVTYILMPLVFNGILSTGLSPHASWRVAMVIPTGLCLIVGLTCLLVSDDCPQGDWSKRLVPTVEVHDANKSDKNEKNEAISVADSEKNSVAPSKPNIKMFLVALGNPNVIILMFMYSCCFGVELAVDNVIGSFFHDHFALSQTTAAMIGSLFGLMNLFSRATGGFTSDFAYKKMGIRGRFLAHFIIICLSGVFLVVFRFSLNSLKEAIVILVIFSIFTQATCGSVFGIVPFVDPKIVGAVSGLVGAGGNIGGLIFAGVFKVYVDNPPLAFMVVGFVVIGVSLMTFLMRIEGRMLIEFRRK